MIHNPNQLQLNLELHSQHRRLLSTLKSTCSRRHRQVKPTKHKRPVSIQMKVCVTIFATNSPTCFIPSHRTHRVLSVHYTETQPRSSALCTTCITSWQQSYIMRRREPLTRTHCCSICIYLSKRHRPANPHGVISSTGVACTRKLPFSIRWSSPSTTPCTTGSARSLTTIVIYTKHLQANIHTEAKTATVRPLVAAKHSDALQRGAPGGYSGSPARIPQ